MDQVIAQWIGSHVIEFLLILSLLVLLIIYLLWRTIETYNDTWWKLGREGWNFLKSQAYIRSFSQRYPKIWGLLQRRLSPLGYLELYLVIGLLTGIIAFSLFGTITDQVMEQSQIIEFDQTLANSLYENATPMEVSVFRIITNLSGRIATFAVGLGIGLFLLIRHRRLLLLSWAAAILGNSLLNAVLKAVFQRGRPEFTNPLLIETNWSFPSGHAMGAVVMYGMLAYMLILRFKRTMSKVIVMTMVVLVLLIGFSRMYLGVHFFSDIMAGYLAGLGWLAIVISGTEVARRHTGWWRSPKASLPSDQEVAPT